MTEVSKALEQITSLVNSLAGKSDTTERREIQDVLMKLGHSLETPYETTMRMYDWHHRALGARMGADLKIFKSLAASSEPLTTSDLVKINGAAPQLLGRILRYLASEDMIVEVDQNTFTANNTTKHFATDDMEGGIHLSFDICGKTYQRVPDFLLGKRYQNLTKNTDTAFQVAWETEEPCYYYLRKDPKLWGYLHHALQLNYREDYLTKFPLEKYLGDFTSKALNDKEAVVFVDVGGSIGIQCRGFKAKFPSIPGRVILQDMPETIEMVNKNPIEGVEAVARDFFTPQLIKGAKFYYHRNIFLDYPDQRALTLLENLLPALGPDSLILIDDKVLPNKGVHRHAAMLDIAMLAQTGSLERTTDEWKELLDLGDCKILDVVTYSDEYDSILVVAPKSSTLKF